MDPTTRFGKVRRMLKEGKAAVVCRKPFIIRLAYETETHFTQKMYGGTDPGRTNIGNAVISNDGDVIYKDHITSDNKDVPQHMKERKAHRQASRRGERLARKRQAKRHNTLSTKLENGRLIPGCEKITPVKDIINTEARFANRKREPNWLTPTVRNLIDTHLNHALFIRSMLPVKEWTLEANRFAFMRMEDGTVQGIDFQNGRTKGYGSVEEYVYAMQDGKCACCGKPIYDCHHVIPRHKGGSDGPDNRVGLCDDCHHKVHIGELDIEKVGMKQKYAALSVLNQAIPYIYMGLIDIFGEGNVHVCQGYETYEYRESRKMLKDHDVDAACISAIGARIKKISLGNVDSYEIVQFRRHDRAIINNQRERTYKLPYVDDKGKTKYKAVARNRRPREEQKGLALSQWYEKTVKEKGVKEATRLRSIMRVDKSKRYKNNPDRIMPGALFQYKGAVYVLTGTLTNGTYYRAYDCGKRNFPASQCHIIKKNCGLVYI